MSLPRRLAVTALFTVAFLSSPLPQSLGQIPNNDTCDLAFVNSVLLNPGLNAGFTNLGATASGVIPSCSGAIPILPPFVGTDVWFVYTSTSSCSVTFDVTQSQVAFPIIAVYDGNGYTTGSCGLLPEIACDGNRVPVTTAVNAGDVLFIQVVTPFPGDLGAIAVDVQSSFSLSLSSPTGTGSLQVDNSCGNPFANYLTVVTGAPGAFPNGWFFGIDITVPDLVTQASLGAPFFGTLDAAGNSSWTAIAGIPSGLSLFAVTVQLDMTGIPLASSDPILYVTP